MSEEDKKVCTFVEGKAGGDGHSHSHGGHSHSHGHDHGSHGHSHEIYDGPGEFAKRDPPKRELEGRSSFETRAFTVGLAGPVGGGKSQTMLRLCEHFRATGHENIVCITNDIFTKEDGEFLVRNKALSPERIRPIETGSCPHAAIREDISTNLHAAEEMTAQFSPELILLESGGDNLSANFSRELADYIIYVIDVAGGDKIPRKGGPGITQSDLLVINKTDLAEAVGADLDVMKRDAKKMRGEGPTLFCQVKNKVGVPEIAQHILDARAELLGNAKKQKS